jgi:hypothetical protein
MVRIGNQVGLNIGKKEKNEILSSRYDDSWGKTKKKFFESKPQILHSEYLELYKIDQQ